METQIMIEWRKGQYSGYGIFLNKRGYIYEGIFVNNRIIGYGLYITPSGNVKSGKFNNFKVKGSGEIFDKIEGNLIFALRKINLDKNVFYGEKSIISKNKLTYCYDILVTKNSNEKKSKGCCRCKFRKDCIHIISSGGICDEYIPGAAISDYTQWD